MSSNEHHYRWHHPIEWLLEKADKWNEEELRAELKNLAHKLDGDQIQDEYESEMDADGYFDELHTHTKERKPWETGVKHFEGKAEDCPICEEEEEAERDED